VHGQVHPLRMTHASSAEGLRRLARGAVVPVWLLVEQLELLGLRDPGVVELDLPFGAPSALLQG
jgi:hypothetical protein